MDNQQKLNRIKSIYRMLISVAHGNLNFRMQVDGEDAQFDELATMLNNIADKLREINYSSPYSKSKIDIGEGDTTLLMVQKVLDYIQIHLEEPLPSTKELSKMFGTNEFTLKENFRKIVKTSIYQFYNDERLKKAHTLIEKTAIPLNEVAIISGFFNYTNFYKAFKKKFHYPPSDINRKDISL